MDNQAETAPPEVAKPRKRGKYAPRKKPEVPLPDNKIRSFGRILSENPTNCSDLWSMWDLPQEAMDRGHLKVSRFKPGSEQTELVADIGMEDYQLGQVAADYGPGRYLLFLSGDPSRVWEKKTAFITVSPEYAAQNGWRSMPPPTRISDMRSAVQGANMLAGTGPVSPIDMAQLIETVSTRSAETVMNALRQNGFLGATAPAPPDPLQSMQNMLGMFTLINSFQEKNLEHALAIVGKGVAGVSSEDEGDGMNWKSLITQGMPIIQSLVGNLLAPKAAPTQLQPDTVVLGPEPVSQPTPQASEKGATPMPPAPSPVQVPMTQQEVQSVSDGVGLLRRFVDVILAALQKAPDGKTAAAGMANYIPGPLVEQLFQLAVWAQERGPNVLAIVDGRLATPKAVDMLMQIADDLSEPEDDTPPNNVAPLGGKP